MLVSARAAANRSVPQSWRLFSRSSKGITEERNENLCFDIVGLINSWMSCCFWKKKNFFTCSIFSNTKIMRIITIPIQANPQIVEYLQQFHQRLAFSLAFYINWFLSREKKATVKYCLYECKHIIMTKWKGQPIPHPILCITTKFACNITKKWFIGWWKKWLSIELKSANYRKNTEKETEKMLYCTQQQSRL